MRAPRRPRRRAGAAAARLAVLAAVVGVVAVAAVLPVAVAVPRAAAATSIRRPSGDPYVLPEDARGRPVPFTVVATGFRPGSLVYVEQCDARPVTAPNWAPTRDCDLGSSPAAAIADVSGTVTFAAGDRNHAFTPFAGLGPQQLFACVAPGARAPDVGLPVYRSCRLRVSSSNFAPTDDQVFLAVTFAGPRHPAPRRGIRVALALAIAVAALGVAAGAGVAVTRRRARS